MNWKNNLEEYNSFYKMHYERIELACKCIDSNPCSILSDSINSLKDLIINSLYNLDWDDSVKEVFISNLDSCNKNLNTLLDSIENNFKRSEKIYYQVQEKLNDLQKKIVVYRGSINNQPNRNSYKKEIIKENDFRKIIYPGYENALFNWRMECDGYSNDCKDLIESIKSDLLILENINRTSITINNIESINPFSNLTSNNNLVPYRFKNSNYLIIDTKNGYDGVLKKVGSQYADGCLDYSGRYCSRIFNTSNSNSVNETGVSKALTSSSKDEILKIVTSELMNGKPSIIQVNGLVKKGKLNRHFVVIAGIKEDADLTNLKESDFLILDPAAAEIKQLDTDMGGRYVRRYLVSADEVSTNNNKGVNEYLVGIYSDPEKYTSMTCKATNY